MDAEQLDAFLSAARGTDHEAAWVTMLGVGLRPGEVTGLRWDDLELDAEPALLHVTHSLQYLQSERRVVLGEPKTEDSYRTLELPPELADALVRHRRAQREQRLRAGSLWSAGGYVFTTDIGEPLRPYMLRRRLDHVTEAAGLGHWHPHELRHTWVSLCSDAGVSLDDLADAAGHSTRSITEDVYRHRVRPTVGSAARQAMERHLAK
jgi:integrase